MIKTTILLNSLALLGASAVVAGDWSPAAIAPLPPLHLEESCLSYDFIDLQYINTDFGSGYFSHGHGYGIGFSKSIGGRSVRMSHMSPTTGKAPVAPIMSRTTSDFFVTGSYSFGEFDDYFCGCNDMAENHKYRLGAGYRRSIGDCVDFTFEGGGEFLDSNYQKNRSRSFDSWGYYIGPGIRARAGRFEMFANAYYFHREGDYSQNHIWPQFRSGGYSHDPYGWRFTTGFIYHFTENFGLKVAAEIEDYDSALLVGGRYHF